MCCVCWECVHLICVLVCMYLGVHKCVCVCVRACVMCVLCIQCVHMCVQAHSVSTTYVSTLTSSLDLLFPGCLPSLVSKVSPSPVEEFLGPSASTGLFW